MMSTGICVFSNKKHTHKKKQKTESNVAPAWGHVFQSWFRSGALAVRFREGRINVDSHTKPFPKKIIKTKHPYAPPVVGGDVSSP